MGCFFIAAQLTCNSIFASAARHNDCTSVNPRFLTISTITVVHTITTHSQRVFFLVTRTSKIYFLDNLQRCKYHPLWSPVYATALPFVYSILTPFTHFTPQAPPLANADFFFVSLKLVDFLIDFFFRLFPITVYYKMLNTVVLTYLMSRSLYLLAPHSSRIPPLNAPLRSP